VKNVAKLMMALCLIVLLVGCFTPGSESVIGTWIMVETKESLSTALITDADSMEYDPTLDNYYSGIIYKITEDKFYIYENRRDLGFEGDVSDIRMTNDSLYTYNNLHTDSSGWSFHFDGGKKLILQTYDVDGLNSILLEYTLEKYTGDFPPESWTMVLEDDDYEPDNDAIHSSNILKDQTQFHTITADDQDYYKFDAVAGESYIIKVLAYMDADLTLYDADGVTRIAYDKKNDLDILGLDDKVKSVLVWTCNSSEMYYLKVSGDSKEGHYQINLADVDISTINYED
jgi:hypothetical protein